GPGTTGTQVQGNLIGTDVTGTTSLRNTGDGVIIEVGATQNTIGGTAPGAANTIAFKTASGGFNAASSRPANAILGTSIFSNAALGIAGATRGPDANAPGTPANCPVIIYADNSGGTTTVIGTLNSTPDTTARIEFFSSAVPDASGYGQGQT